MDVGRDDARARQHVKIAVLLAIARQDLDEVTVGMETRHEMASDEAGAAENHDALRFHRCLRSTADEWNREHSAAR
jgi:hypothetical protein